MKSHGAWPAFLTTFKPMLKRAQGTFFYADIRKLLTLWLHAKRLQRLVDGQNTKLYEAARERDRLIQVLEKTRSDFFSMHVGYQTYCRWATVCPEPVLQGHATVTTTGVTCHGST
jgi:hypothetical protein